MLHFTKEERLVLWVLLSVIFIGSALNLAFKKYPFLKDSVNLMETGALYPKLDVNTATVEELESLPFIGAYTAKNIAEYREAHGAFLSLAELKKVAGIRDKNFEKFKNYLTINAH